MAKGLLVAQVKDPNGNIVIQGDGVTWPTARR